MLLLIFRNDLLNDIKSKIELFADVKVLVRPLLKEITQMDLNKLSLGRYLKIKILYRKI